MEEASPEINIRDATEIELRKHTKRILYDTLKTPIVDGGELTLGDVLDEKRMLWHFGMMNLYGSDLLLTHQKNSVPGAKQVPVYLERWPGVWARDLMVYVGGYADHVMVQTCEDVFIVYCNINRTPPIWSSQWMAGAEEENNDLIRLSHTGVGLLKAVGSGGCVCVPLGKSMILDKDDYVASMKRLCAYANDRILTKLGIFVDSQRGELCLMAREKMHEIQESLLLRRKGIEVV